MSFAPIRSVFPTEGQRKTPLKGVVSGADIAEHLNTLKEKGTSEHEQEIPGPVPQEDHAHKPEQNRAAGGRVVASNIHQDPSEAQKSAGNYSKDRVWFQGLEITIENAKGHYRKGVGPDGVPWSVKMPCSYGYFLKSEGADGDHVDVYLGPHSKSPHAFIIDQVDAETHHFDETKTFLGFASKEQALRCYKAAFSDGKATARIGHVKELPLGEFKYWLRNGNTKKPISEHDFRKVSHEKAEYKFPALSEIRRCSRCTMYVRPHGEGSSCTAVLSPIQPGGVCKLFERKA